MSGKYSVLLRYHADATALRYGLRCRSDAGARKAAKGWLKDTSKEGRIEVECDGRKVGAWHWVGGLPKWTEAS